MKITSSTMIAAAAVAGLLSGCATTAKQECKGKTTACCKTDGKCEKGNCGSKADCKSKSTCKAKGNCGTH